MYQSDFKWLINQKKRMLDKTISIAKRLQDGRRKIAEPYVLALEKQFPDKDTYNLIQIADADLQTSNENYKKLTKKLEELAEFNHGPFNELVRLTKQTQP